MQPPHQMRSSRAPCLSEQSALLHVLIFSHAAGGGQEYLGELLLRPGALIAESEQDSWFSLYAPPTQREAATGRLRLRRAA